MNKRGIVLSPPFELLPTGGIRLGGGIEPLDIRKYLLYWDEIDYATNNLIHIEGGNDIKFLEECKVLKRSRINFYGTYTTSEGRIFIEAQQAAFEANEKNEPGCWSLAQLSTSPYYVNSQSKECLEFELFKCLPVPQHDVPLNDILEFKEKRKDEILELRGYLDELYQSVINSSDPSKALSAAINKIEISLNNIDKTLNESSIAKIKKSLTGIINDNIDLGICLGATFQPECRNIAIGAGAFYLYRKLLQTPVIQDNNVRQPLTYIKSIKEEL